MEEQRRKVPVRSHAAAWSRSTVAHAGRDRRLRTWMQCAWYAHCHEGRRRGKSPAAISRACVRRTKRNLPVSDVSPTQPSGSFRPIFPSRASLRGTQKRHQETHQRAPKGPKGIAWLRPKKTPGNSPLQLSERASLHGGCRTPAQSPCMFCMFLYYTAAPLLLKDSSRVD